MGKGTAISWAMSRPHVTRPHARFSVVVYGDTVFHAGTYDEVNSRIIAHHTSRQKAAGFRIDFSVKHYDPGEEIPYRSVYAVVNNHVEVM